MSELPERFGTEIHAFVLMDNHYHLLVPGRRIDLSEILHWLQAAFSVRFNWAHHRRGHVFQGRLVKVVKQIPGLNYAVGAQGIPRFWRQSD